MSDRDPTHGERQGRYRENQAKKGLVLRKYWIHESDEAKFKALAEKSRAKAKKA